MREILLQLVVWNSTLGAVYCW